jgi:hypothetical protein
LALNPPDEKRQLPEEIMAYSPWMAFFQWWSSADATAAITNGDMTVIIISTTSFLIVPFILNPPFFWANYCVLLILKTESQKPPKG